MSSISNTKMFVLYIIALILVNSIYSLATKKTKTLKSNTVWGDSANCYAYKVEQENLNPPSNRTDTRILLGINEVTEKLVYLYTQTERPTTECVFDTPVEYDFKIYSISKYVDSNFNYLNPNYSGYFCYTYKTCKEARNQGDPTPLGKLEVVSPDIISKWYSSCNYLCRSVYGEQKGRCTYNKQADGLYHCTYLVNLVAQSNATDQSNSTKVSSLSNASGNYNASQSNSTGTNN